MGTACRRTVLVALALALGTAPLCADAEGILGDGYPIDASVSFHKALLHWVDSLAMLTGGGTTGGKTIPAHRRQFDQTFGRPSRKDVTMLERYHAVRSADIRRAAPEERDRITLSFFETANLDEALERAGKLLEPNHAKAFEAAMRHFAPRYERIWKDGAAARGFLGAIRDSDRRGELADLLIDVARFLDVPADAAPRPVIVLAPVPEGYGTHAQAVGPYLLIEIREGETLAQEAAPIVHENVHFLYRKIPEARRKALERAALDAGGDEAWGLLREALPTAIAQGVANRAFLKDEWSHETRWYHDASVDTYAKRIFPLVDEAMSSGKTLDESLVLELVAAYGTPAESSVTPR